MVGWQRLRSGLLAAGPRRALPSLVLLGVGWLLSPLCWWNDLLINLPLAVGFARLVSVLNPSWWVPALVSGYWLSNLAGIVLMQNGALGLVKEEKKTQPAREVAWGLLSSSVYTLAILLAVKLHWLAIPSLESFSSQAPGVLS